MRTTKPIATISFNSPEFLSLKLEGLVKSGILSFWAFVKHFPEDDEGGKKEHCHLFVVPAKMLQTDDLKKELQEWDPDNPTKPKGCISWHSSVFSHWYLYSLHDRGYLASKGQSRRFFYRHDEMKTSDDDDLLFKARSIDHLSLSPYSSMLDAIEQGVTWEEYFARGTIPLNQVIQMEKSWFILLNRGTNRNGRKGHENEN